VKVATNAQTKLRHIVLILNMWLISYEDRSMRINRGCGRREVTSIENNTPPIGEPKATATPAADAAVMTSLILPEANVNTSNKGKNEL